MTRIEHPLARSLAESAVGPIRFAVLIIAVLMLGQLPALAVSLSNELQPNYQPLTRSLGKGFSTSAQPAPAPSLGGYVAAPVPDEDTLPPRASADASPVIGPGLFQNKSDFGGDGYIPNSSQAISQQPKHMPLPGISLKVPLY